MKKILPIFIPLVLLYLIRSLFLSTQALLSSIHEVTSLREKLAQEKKQNEFLAQRIYIVDTSAFIEQEARQKLGLVRYGEELVITSPPPKHIQKFYHEEKENWQKWIELFL